MSKEILTFGDIDKYYYLTRFLLVKKTASAFLVTCMTVIKLSH